MISTAEVAEDLIKNSSLLEEGLAKGIISYSALARELRPKIEERLMKKVSRGAIVMAIKRISQRLTLKNDQIHKKINLHGLTVRSNLVELTYLNSDTIAEEHKEVFLLSEKNQGVFCNLTQGVRETMVVVGREILPKVEKIFRHERLIAKIKNLSAITILLAKDTAYVPGAYYSILKLFAWNGINIIDVISTYSELTIIFSNDDVDRAFSTLTDYINHNKTGRNHSF